MSRYRKPFTLFKRGNYWYYRTYDASGYRTTAKTTGQTTKTGAMNYCNELFKQNLLGITDQTLEEYAAGFFDDNSPYIRDRNKPLSASSIASHRNYLSRHILPVFGKTKLHQISFSSLKNFRQSLLDNKYKANTINGIFQTFNAILKFAYMDNKIQKNPLQGFGSLERPKQKDSFRRSEIINIIKKTPPEFRDFVTLLAITGMRRSECYGIRPEDVKCDNGNFYIELKEQLTDLGYYTPLKTSDQRIIPIPECAIKLCHFPGCSIGTLQNRLSPLFKACDNAEERQLSFHSIRHFFITDTKSNEVQNLIVETIAGHSLKGMEAVYTNFHIEDLKSITNWQIDLLNEIDS